MEERGAFIFPSKAWKKPRKEENWLKARATKRGGGGVEKGKRNQFHAVIFQHFIIRLWMSGPLFVSTEPSSAAAYFNRNHGFPALYHSLASFFFSLQAFAAPLYSRLLWRALLFFKRASYTSEVELELFNYTSSKSCRLDLIFPFES